MFSTEQPEKFYSGRPRDRCPAGLASCHQCFKVWATLCTVLNNTNANAAAFLPACRSDTGSRDRRRGPWHAGGYPGERQHLQVGVGRGECCCICIIDWPIASSAPYMFKAAGLPPACLPACRESEALLGSPEAQAGEAALEERAYRSSLAQGVHRASKTLAGGLLVRRGHGCCWKREGPAPHCMDGAACQ